jgi:hypothetical protein
MLRKFINWKAMLECRFARVVPEIAVEIFNMIEGSEYSTNPNVPYRLELIMFVATYV